MELLSEAGGHTLLLLDTAEADGGDGVQQTGGVGPRMVFLLFVLVLFCYQDSDSQMEVVLSVSRYTGDPRAFTILPKWVIARNLVVPSRPLSFLASWLVSV